VSRYLKWACLGVMVGSVGAAAWWAVDEMVVARTVNESRTVADMAENVGRWASQYGGVHVRTEGATAKLPGTYLTRSVYAHNAQQEALLQGARADDLELKREALKKVEAYHWKNPALVQRELADVLLKAGSRAQYRMTARTVLNPSNEPNAFELEALTALQQQAANGEKAHEYWKVDDGRLFYARAVVAQKSCLKCHDSQAKAPDFLRTHKSFNGGGGFGYVEGKPAGVISVSLPVPVTSALLSNGLPMKAWGALGVTLAAGLLLLTLKFRKPPVKAAAGRPKPKPLANGAELKQAIAPRHQAFEPEAGSAKAREDKAEMV
jgi:Protein of unknown function (DUF3365)